MSEDRVAEVRAQLAALEDPRMREINERHGDDHGANLTRLRALARALKTDHELSGELWATGDTAARLVALLICRPRQYSAEQLDGMLREARAPKVQDWLINYVVKKSPHREQCRREWMADADANVAAGGWALAAMDVADNPHLLDLGGLLERIEAEMKTAPDRLQWQMNTTLATIGIRHPELRPRALAIGERLEVLKDYPTAPNCTSPYAPIWIDEMVRRQSAG
ncbi:MAG: DNA alkylation repair protein [Microbacterium sp.]|uniref:DNA alkylation repair protein n=1 Tax=Microbacterium sp. TaxID=51671 RepID=UPI000DB39783|nr:DNA alkylation repair protein [Microbacterium sp.]PZU36947.1 MAG: DNA alkylation repair protein [Microbacterium sp.]